MLETLEDILQQRVWAVVGATDNVVKFGYKIFMFLQQQGCKVYPVNPRLTAIEGCRCYASLAELPVKPDVVNIVVPPSVTEEVVKQCHALGIKRVWMQPGAASPAAIAFCEAHGINLVVNQCVMRQM